MIKYKKCGHTSTYCPGREITADAICYDCKTALFGTVVNFVRFGAPPENGQSYNCATGQCETGVSVYAYDARGFLTRPRCEFTDRQPYIGTGIAIGTGGDDEILVNILAIKKATKKQLERISIK